MGFVTDQHIAFTITGNTTAAGKRVPPAGRAPRPSSLQEGPAEACERAGDPSSGPGQDRAQLGRWIQALRPPDPPK